MSHSDPVIIMQQLTRRFGDLVAVDHLDLSIAPGEIFGLVGPDGAGKTTTLRLLAGIMHPTSGSASVVGYDVRQQPEAIKHHIGYMAQQFSLYEDLTILENLRFFADIYHVSAADRRERIPRLLQFSRLERFTARRAGRLSGGMQKKLALACTLIHQPRVIYLDEPTTGVDPVSRREFWDILGDLHLEGITIVVSTPYMDEAERCSRVGLMYQGRLIACDPPAVIQNRIQGDMLEIRPDRFNGSTPALENLPGIHDVQTYGDMLHIFVDDADQRVAAVRHTLESHGQQILWMRVTPPRMEEAFIHLVRQHEARESLSAPPPPAH